MADKLESVLIDYTNWRGERRVRHVLPLEFSFMSTEWHPQPQWTMTALEMGTKSTRHFAMADIHAWTPWTGDNHKKAETP